jgi:HTH-type transcriptional regulator / antitoxin HigA
MIDPPDPIEALRYYMESRGLERRDLEPFLGSRARVAEVLNRKRPLSIKMIRKLRAGLGISAEILIRPYKVKRSAA